jgi:phosphoglycerate dehydrogenase-like enzyme
MSEGPRRVAVASRSFSKHPVLRRELLDLYPHATFNDGGRSLGGDELVAFLDGHDGAITALERLDDALFERLPGLRVIGKYGVGLDMVDIHAMARRGIRLGWTGGVNRRSVSELVISCAIALLRHVPRARDEVRDGQWRQLMGRQLSGKVVGIIGCGFVGKDLAVLLQAFGCRVLAHDILDFPDFYGRHGIERVELNDLLARSDVVSLHLPFDASTRNILSAVRLRRMRRGSLLINAARGGLVDEVELKAMLIDGHLAGAAFDVFDGEPPQDLELLRLPNMLATPHIGGSAEEAVVAMGRAAIAGLAAATVPDPREFEAVVAR